jgi:hypothetical protein
LASLTWTMNRTIRLLPILSILACAIASSSNPAAQIVANHVEPSGEPPALAAPGEERGIVALDQALRDLGNPFTVLCVAAHPGDEDAGTLAYYHKKLGARTVVVFATRAEGESAPAGPELDEEIGVARTREALEAVRIEGADAFFLNLSDAGPALSADKTINLWGHDETVRRLVQAIRQFRPDVILTSDDVGGAPSAGGAAPAAGTEGTAETPPSAGASIPARAVGEGMGQHQALGRLLPEAFDGAANSKLFPAPGYDPWQAYRLFLKTDDKNFDVAVNLAEYDQVRGVRYADIGRAAFEHHTWRDAPAPDEQKSHYKLVRSAGDQPIKPGGTLFTGLTVQPNAARSIVSPIVADMTLTEAIGKRGALIDALSEKLAEKRAEGSVDELRARYGPEFFRVVRFTGTLERALTLALGIDFVVSANDTVLIPGQKITVKLSLLNGGGRNLVAGFQIPETFPGASAPPAYKSLEPGDLNLGASLVKEVEYEIPAASNMTLPHSEHLYETSYYPLGSSLPGLPIGQPAGNQFLAIAEIGLDQMVIPVPAIFRYDIAPSIQISVTPSVVLLKDLSSPRDVDFNVRLINRTPGPFSGSLWVVPLALAKEDYEPTHVTFAREDEEVTVPLNLAVPAAKAPLAPDVLIEFRPETPAQAKAIASIKVAAKEAGVDVSDGLNVGCVSGSGHTLDLALRELGIAHYELSLAGGRGDSQSHVLSRLDAVVVDRFALRSHPEVISASNRLLEYVKKGGNLIILSQRPEDWNGMQGARLAPLSIKIQDAPVILDNTPVKILDADNPAMSKPNKLTAADLEGWGQDRPLFVPREWAPEYTALVELAGSFKGGLLLARVGDGTMVYVSYDWNQALRVMNPGAYRLLANLLSLARTAHS